jgi:hypothetical protein
MEGVNQVESNLQYVCINFHLNRNILRVKRAALSFAGFTTLFFGGLAFVTPLPSTLIVYSGLAILSGQYIWARRLMKKIKHEARVLGEIPLRWEHEIVKKLGIWF